MFQTSLSTWLKQPTTLKEAPSGTVLQSKVTGGLRDSKQNDNLILDATIPSRPADAEAQDDPPKAHNSSSSSLPSNVIVEHCTEEHIKSFQRLNALLLPIPYQPSFYHETLNDPIIASITRVALWQDRVRPHENSDRSGAEVSKLDKEKRGQVVSAIRCRLLAPPPHETDQSPSLYISTITTLAPFRGHGIANHLLSIVTRVAVKEYGAKSITAHVWEANEEAMDWYKNRGFKVIAKQDDYYRKLAPRTTAFVVRKEIGPTTIV